MTPPTEAEVEEAADNLREYLKDGVPINHKTDIRVILTALAAARKDTERLEWWFKSMSVFQRDEFSRKMDVEGKDFRTAIDEMREGK